MFHISISLRPATSTAGRCKPRWAWIVGAGCLAALPVIATASPVDIPNAFEAGGLIDAESFNENFDAVADAVDDNDARIAMLEGGDASIPAGAVMFFNLNECPEGWNELEEARGRSVVGMNGSAGTLLGEVGVALEDLAEVSHGHTLADEASVSTASTSVAHTHGSGSYSTSSTGSHNHQWRDGSASYNSLGNVAPFPPIPFQLGSVPQVNFGTSADLFTDNDGAHSHSVNGTSAAASSTSHNHSVNLAGQPVAAATSSLPYLQLLACQRA